MSKWDIDPGGVRTVLLSVEEIAKEFEGQMTALNTGVEGAATESSSNIVGSALAGFAESVTANIQFVFARTGSCMGGCAQATNAYLDGDFEMAANAQASAYAAPNPLDTMPGRGGGGPQ